MKTQLVCSQNFVLMLSAQFLPRHLQMQIRSWPGARLLPEEMSLTGDFSQYNALTTGHAQDQVYKYDQAQGVNVLLETKIVCVCGS